MVSVFNVTTGTKGTLDYVFCKEMFIKIAAVGTKSSMMTRFREGNSLYSKIVTVMQL